MMDSILAWGSQHPIEFAAVITGIHHAFDAVVDSLPAPQPMSSPAYQFAYAFVNKFAGNYRKKDQA